MIIQGKAFENAISEMACSGFDVLSSYCEKKMNWSNGVNHLDP